MDGLADDFIHQSIPWVQFGYDLRTPNHTLGVVWQGGKIGFIRKLALDLFARFRCSSEFILLQVCTHGYRFTMFS